MQLVVLILGLVTIGLTTTTTPTSCSDCPKVTSDLVTEGEKDVGDGSYYFDGLSKLCFIVDLEGATLSDLHIHIAKEPLANPNPASFDLEWAGLETSYFKICTTPRCTSVCGDTFYIYLHANVVLDDGSTVSAWLEGTNALTHGSYSIYKSCCRTPCASDGNPCTDDVCDTRTGTCNYVPNHATCSDGNLCTLRDYCSEGVCQPGEAKYCNDGNVCTDDSCDPASGACHYSDNSAPCSDGNYCTTDDYCQHGCCQPGTPVVCSDENECTDDHCDATSGTCKYTPNNAQCSDDNACTLRDHCYEGECVSGTPTVCDDYNVCTDDSCNSHTGYCVFTPNEASCSDGNGCTMDDVCYNGKCVGGKYKNCDDSNVCTDDSCDCVTGDCVYSDKTGPCYDGDLCTCHDYCSEGECIPGTPKDCDDGNVCTDDSCDPHTGACLHTDNTAPCSDSNPCTVDDTCSHGSCVPGKTKDCNDNNVCTDDYCDCKTGECSYSNNDGSCKDGNLCTLYDTCHEGECVPGSQKNCDDGNVCTDDSCDPTTGHCVNTYNSAPCDDSNGCTVDDVCYNGACVPGSTKDCNDDNVCTDDYCDCWTGECAYTNKPGSCVDDNPCTLYDTCHEGECIPGRPKNCDDGNYCTDDTCDEHTGECVHTYNSLPCDDGSSCTLNDVCYNGTCSGGTPENCDDGNVCTDDRCDAYGGCVHINNHASCSDGDACTLYDICDAGICTSGHAKDCGDESICTDDSCDPTSGMCVYTFNNASCNDGNACTVGDHCEAGSCTSGELTHCDDDNVCTDDCCDPLTGECIYTPNTASCSDGNACTYDVCLDGVCVSGNNTDCNDGNVCTDDSCDYYTGACVHTPNSDPCSDGNACTKDDYCSQGSCVPGPQKDCNDGNVCTNDVCDITKGECVHEYNHLPCSDNDACTCNDVCEDGECVPGHSKNCDDGNDCTDDSCDPYTGACVHTNNHAPCNDYNDCTVDDVCRNGTCASGDLKDCSDDNVCTDDSCDRRTGECVNYPNTVTCSDGNACTLYDVCADGECVPGAIIDCIDENDCTDDACDIYTGECVYTNNNATCSDNNPCTTDDICSEGQCTGGTKPCDDDNVCTDDYCDVYTGDCQHIHNSVPCSDDNACTSVDMCYNGECKPGETKNCDDGNICTDDSCDTYTGNCTHTWNNVPCSDYNGCTVDDVCHEGLCIPGSPKNCDDSDICTDDFCDHKSGECSYVYNTAPCSDDDACTCFDACYNGVCVPGTPTNCDDGDVCTDDICDSTTGVCSHVKNEAPCSDGNPCTVDDTCHDGYCSGEPLYCDDGNSCTDDFCDGKTGNCSYVNNNAPCSDDNQCTCSDHCYEGECVPGHSRNCDDDDECTDDSCDPETGECVHTWNTAPCSDGNACTLDDVCYNGNCVPGTPKQCGDSNVCTDDSCDYHSGECVYVNNTSPCSDNDACTCYDVCHDGYCVPGYMKDCDDDNICTDDSCDASTGTCTYTWNTAPCDDGDACTTGDVCYNGGCTAGPATHCDDDNECTDDRCDPHTGTCVYSNNDNPCDDGNACTLYDLCHNGACVPGGRKCCNDGNVCTDDTCDEHTGDCVHTNNESPCSDDNACTTNDVCYEGHCVPGSPKHCADDNVCTDDSCDHKTGACVYTNNTAPCSDGNSCTYDICSGGVCVSGTGSDCNDHNLCTDDSCDAETGACHHTYNSDPCDDGNACTSNDVCSEGTCTSGTSKDCDDGNLCTDDACGEDGECVHTWNSVPCDDGDACTRNDYCYEGSCAAGRHKDCSDGNVCTDDSCDATTGECVYTNNHSPCSDDNACTVDDVCLDGICVSGSGNECDDGNECTDDSCNSCTGECVYTNNKAPCDDGNSCTLYDICREGTCVSGHSKECNDGNLCTDDSCDASGECMYTNNTAPCSDGNSCTMDDVCHGGICTSGPSKDCTDDNICTDDHCDPYYGTCVHSNNKAPCDDGNTCTVGDICSGGMCHSGEGKHCNDNNVCTDDTCDSETGGCVYVNNNSPCSDHDACTADDMCSGGVCVSGPPTSCDDHNECTDDRCDSHTGACVNTNNHAPCDDGNACTLHDQCYEGACVPGTAIRCDDGNPCTDDYCSEDGTCSHTNNDADCDDGNACTVGDYCHEGVCTSGGTSECDDGNVCTDDHCDAHTGECVYTDNTAPCSDGDSCTLYDFCCEGTCVSGNHKDCNDGNLCTDDYCDSESGECVYTNNNDTCTDHNACTVGDVCRDGACVPGTTTPCDDDNVCTDDRCDSSSGTCVYTNNNAPCDDGNSCTIHDVCQEGSCVPGTSTNCNDNNVCTDDSCDGYYGMCVYTNNENPCNDNNACTMDDYCHEGSCVPGVLVDCDDGNPCTDDFCDPYYGTCTHVNNHSPCSDDNACTVDDICSEGVCVPGKSRDCNDGNVCTDDYCDAHTGECYSEHNTAPCSDGNACTLFDVCCDGACTAGSPKDCNDNNFCTDDSCEATTGKCSHLSNSLPCTDGNACTVGDVCSGGHCAPGTRKDCSDGNICTNDYCDGNTGECVYSPNTMPCSTGDACSAEGICRDSVCVAGVPLLCDDDDNCTWDECEPTTGCEYHPVCPDPSVYNWPTRTEDGNVTGYIHAFTTDNAMVIIWRAVEGWTTNHIAAYLGIEPPANLPDGLSYSYTAPSPVAHIELVIPLCDIPGSDCDSTFFLATSLDTNGGESWLQSETHFLAAQGCCCFDYSSYYNDTAEVTLSFTSGSAKRFVDDPDEIAAAIAGLLQISRSSVYVISHQEDSNGFSTVEIGISDSQTTPAVAAELLATLTPADFEKIGLGKVSVGAEATASERSDNKRSMSSSMALVPAIGLLLGSFFAFMLR